MTTANWCVRSSLKMVPLDSFSADLPSDISFWNPQDMAFPGKVFLDPGGCGLHPPLGEICGKKAVFGHLECDNWYKNVMNQLYAPENVYFAV